MFCLRTFKLTCLLACFTVCETAIKWDIKGEYVIYGKNTTLTCNGTSCPSKAIKKWIGGPDYNLLCFDDYSTDIFKYEMMSNHTQPEFDLMIKNFTFSDANCEYTCSCGFLQYTNMLKLNDSNFIYLPVVDEDSSKQNVDTFQIDLLMKVFPLPTCELFYEDNSFPVNLTVIKGLTGSDLELYTVRIKRTIDLKSYICKGNVNLKCQVRSLQHQFLYHEIDFCEDEHTSENIIILIVSVFGSMIVIVLSAAIAFITYVFVKKKRFNIESEYPTERELIPIAVPSNEIEATRMIHLLSNETEATSMLNLPSNEADTTSMLHLLSNETATTSMINVHVENVKYEHSSIAQLKDDEKG